MGGTKTPEGMRHPTQHARAEPARWHLAVENPARRSSAQVMSKTNVPRSRAHRVPLHILPTR